MQLGAVRSPAASWRGRAARLRLCLKLRQGQRPWTCLSSGRPVQGGSPWRVRVEPNLACCFLASCRRACFAPPRLGCYDPGHGHTAHRRRRRRPFRAIPRAQGRRFRPRRAERAARPRRRSRAARGARGGRAGDGARRVDRGVGRGGGRGAGGGSLRVGARGADGRAARAGGEADRGEPRRGGRAGGAGARAGGGAAGRAPAALLGGTRGDFQSHHAAAVHRGDANRTVQAARHRRLGDPGPDDPRPRPGAVAGGQPDRERGRAGGGGLQPAGGHRQRPGALCQRLRGDDHGCSARKATCRRISRHASW